MFISIPVCLLTICFFILFLFLLHVVFIWRDMFPFECCSTCSYPIPWHWSLVSVLDPQSLSTCSSVVSYLLFIIEWFSRLSMLTFWVSWDKFSRPCLSCFSCIIFWCLWIVKFFIEAVLDVFTVNSHYSKMRDVRMMFVICRVCYMWYIVHISLITCLKYAITF